MKSYCEQPVDAWAGAWSPSEPGNLRLPIGAPGFLLPWSQRERTYRSLFAMGTQVPETE